MKVETIEVELHITHNLGDYSNVKPNGKVIAHIDAGDDWYEEFEFIQSQLRELLEGEIDAAMEADGTAPKYYHGPRYCVLEHRLDKVAVLLPDESIEMLPGAWGDLRSPNFNGRRLIVAQGKLAKFAAKGWTCIDCTDGNFDKLPKALKMFKYYANRDTSIMLVISGNEQEADIPAGWRDIGRDGTTTRMESSFWDEIKKRYHGYELFDCTDGDFSKLPEMVTVRTALAGGLIAIIDAGIDTGILPDGWRRFNWVKRILPVDGLEAAVSKLYPGNTIADCRDGDFSALPDFGADEDEDDDDDYDEDELF